MRVKSRNWGSRKPGGPRRAALFVPSNVENVVLAMKLRDFAAMRGFDLSIFVWDRRRNVATGVCTDSNGEHPLLQNEGAGRFGRAFGYFRWMIQVLRSASRLPCSTLVLCIDLASAIPVAVVSLVRDIRFVFLDGDNLSLSFRWPAVMMHVLSRLEAFVAHRATLHVVPGSGRWPQPERNLRIVPNSPSRNTLTRARGIARAQCYSRPKTFTLYANGWLTSGRGMAAILAATRALDEVAKLVVAGQPGCREADELIRLPNVDFVGLLGLEEALALYERCHLVLTFYDPSVAINRLAEPTKWHDCIAMGTPFVTNDGVLTAGPFLEQVACFAVPYGDPDALIALVRRLDRDRALWESARRQICSIRSVPWDEGMGRVIEDALGDVVQGRPGGSQ